jgi:SAM-dependent methyltransferase
MPGETRTSQEEPTGRVDVNVNRTMSGAPQIPYLHLLACSYCRGPMHMHEGVLRCRACSRTFAFEDDIPLLFAPNDPGMFDRDVTDLVRQFYEKNPFPNYEETDDVGALLEKARRGVFARLLDEQLPFGIRILECGCGTGQLSNFLGIARRAVFGTDVCLNSLRLANGFRKRNGLRYVHFLQMNLFRPAFPLGSFDVVISNGVLHSTSDTYLGFQTLSGLVKPGGYLIIGLYHRYGRLATDFRRVIFRLSGGRMLFLDPRLRREGLGKARRSSWYADQYLHPHEKKYTVGEVLRWLEPNGLRLIKSIPKTRFHSGFTLDERLFEPEPAGRPLERTLIELAQTFTGDREGGFFTVIAQREA